MAEDPEDLDRFLYGDEAPLVAAEVSVAETIDEAKLPFDVEETEKQEEEKSPELEDGEQEDEEEEDIEFVFGSNPVTEPVKRGLTQVSMSGSTLEPGQIAPSASASGILVSNAIGTTPKTAMDFNAVGQLNGQSIYDVDLDGLGDKPWNKPGADITDYFNYGLNEISWRAYCLKQKGVREEFGPPKRINVFDGAMGGMPFPMPPGFPPMPPGMPFPFPPPGFRPPTDGTAFPFPPPPMFPPAQLPPAPATAPPAESEDRSADKRASSSRYEESARSRSTRTASSRRERSRSRSRDSKRRR